MSKLFNSDAPEAQWNLAMARRHGGHALGSTKNTKHGVKFRISRAGMQQRSCKLTEWSCSPRDREAKHMLRFLYSTFNPLKGLWSNQRFWPVRCRTASKFHWWLVQVQTHRSAWKDGGLITNSDSRNQGTKLRNMQNINMAIIVCPWMHEMKHMESSMEQKMGKTHSSLIVGKWTSTRLLNVSPGCIVTLTEVVSQQFQASISHKAGKAWNCLWIGNAAIRIPLRFVCVPSSETWSENYINSFSSKWRKELTSVSTMVVNRGQLHLILLSLTSTFSQCSIGGWNEWFADFFPGTTLPKNAFHWGLKKTSKPPIQHWLKLKEWKPPANRLESPNSTQFVPKLPCGSLIRPAKDCCLAWNKMLNEGPTVT